MSAATPTTVSLTANEENVLQTLMRDVQIAVSAFYAKTATSADVESLGTEVRSFLSATQTLNERLGGTIADKAMYRSALSGTADGELIDAVKYVRNVAQHVMHVVRPSDDSGALIGGPHGLRLYVDWDDIPPAAHDALHARTQALRPAFEARLRGQEVVSTMLSVLRAFAAVAPQLVHRDQRGEWTGFPLKTQPSVPTQLHPEEPDTLQRAFSWLDSRLPNGDARLVVGQVTVDDEPHLVGYTLVGQRFPAIFIESSQQVEDDVARGFEYVTGDLTGRVELHRDPNSHDPEHSELRSVDEIGEWAAAIDRTQWVEDWGVDPADEDWAHAMRFARPGYLLEPHRYEIRRAQRLLA